MGTAQLGSVQARFRMGVKDYSVGNHPLWEVFRMFHQMSKTPLVIGGLALASGYAWAMMRRAEVPVSQEVVAFTRREQMQRLTRLFTGKTFAQQRSAGLAGK